ncbi:RNF213 [Mytilus coruscus]|uniref:RNF213 n=1 Tax=Mytilus coruscus TaxID=42192 RepID=A0A6J8CBX7_MYTCO|nr:RNF213 [Mytilus coruscus]
MLSEEYSEIRSEDEIELTENNSPMFDNQTGKSPELNEIECKNKSEQTDACRKCGRFSCNDLFKCIHDKWRSVDIGELRSIYEMPDCFDLYQKPISDVSQLPQRDTSMSDVQFDVVSFIRSCLQQALASVRKTDEESDKNTKQVKSILSSKETNVAGEGKIYIAKKEELGQNRKTFMSGLVVHLIAILKEYLYQHQWLNTAEVGTFRRPVMQYIEDKVGHWLAGILAVMDKNENFDILSEDMTKGWKGILWREIINDPQITQIRCSNLESGQKTNATGGYNVEEMSKEETHFKSKMPFSWIIYRELNSIWKMYQNIPIPDTQVNERNTVLRTAKTLRTMPLGKLIAQINKEDVVEAIQDYVSDFVLMIYPVKSPSEHQFVCDNVLKGCKAMVYTDISEDILASLIRCHATFDLHEKQFRNFESIVQIWPDCSIRCLEIPQETQTLVTDEEITLDLMALHLLLKNLEPLSKENLNKPRGREQWIRFFCDYRPVVERIFGFFGENEQGHHLSTRFTQVFQTTRCLWTRATVLKLFIEHVCRDDSEVLRCMPLWNMLETNADLKTLESFQKMKRFLKVVSSKNFSQQKCVNCEKPYTGTQDTLASLPLILPCNHTICRKCVDEINTSPNVKCPTCDKLFFQKTFNKLKPTRGLKAIRENGKVDIACSGINLAYQDIRRRCNSFSMEVVTQLCFAEGTQPSNDIVKELLCYITAQSQKGQEVTEQLTIFDNCIDSISNARAILLQHLMQTSLPEVQQCLEYYFRRPLGIVDRTTTCTSEQSHSLIYLFLQSMEDFCHQRYPDENGEMIQAATEMLNNSCRNLRLDSYMLFDNIANLSRTRFSLTVAANFMYKVFIEMTVTLDSSLQRLFTAVEHMCEECGSKWPRRFFIKYLCRCYGIESYHTIRLNCDMAVERWITLPELQDNKKEECHDRFIVCGEDYVQMRETVIRAALNEDAETITNLLEVWDFLRFAVIYYFFN